MGAWGYGAYENDTAGDWMWKHFVPRIKKTILATRGNADEMLAAIAIVLDLDLVPWFSKEEIGAAFAYVEKQDGKYHWKDDPARRRYLKNLRRRFNRTPGNSWSPMGLIHKNIRPKGVRKPEPAGKLPRKAKKPSKKA